MSTDESAPPAAGWRPKEDWTIAEWTDQTKALRRALLPLDIQLPECLPGEAQDCGIPVREHYDTYLGILQARAAALASVNLTEPDATARYRDAAEHFAAEYHAEGVAERG